MARQAPAFGPEPCSWPARRLLSVQNLALGAISAQKRQKARRESKSAPKQAATCSRHRWGRLRCKTAIRPVGASDAVPSAFDCFYLSGRGVAQLVAHLLWEQEAAGSSPASPTKCPCKSRKGTLNHHLLLDGIVPAFQTVA